MASGLITRRSNLVAVVISNLTNLYYPEILAELTQRLSDRGIRVLLFALHSESEVDAMLDQVWRYLVDGAIIAARLAREQLREFAIRRVPVVLYNRFGEGENVSSICCDSVGGERQLSNGWSKRDTEILGLFRARATYTSARNGCRARSNGSRSWVCRDRRAGDIRL